MRGREQDRGETERECVRDSVFQGEKDSISDKIDSARKTCGVNVGLIS